MPTTSSEASTRAASLQAAQGDVLDEAEQLLTDIEASGEQAMSEVMKAFNELARAVLPGVLTQPVRAVDLALELMQQSLNLQRRLLHDLLATVQVAMVEAGWYNANVDVRATADGGSTRRQTARKAA